jgi:hypothetical protein
MLARSNVRRELLSLFLSAGIILFLLLVVVMPANSQAPMPPTAGPVEQIIDEPVPTALLIILIAQFIILVSLMTLYLSRATRLQSVRRMPAPHWWQHVRFHH